MKTKISVKIFLLIMLAFIMILAVSTKINIQNRIDSTNHYLLQRIIDFDDLDNLQQQLGIEYNHYPQYDEVIQKINSIDYISENNNLYQCLFQQDDKVVKWFSLSPYLDNYIHIYDDSSIYISIADLSLSQRQSLKTYLMQKLTDYSYSIPGEAEVKYVLDDEQLIYLQWGEDSYGQLDQHQIQSASVDQFCIDGEKSIQSQYDSQLFLSQQKDLEHVLQLKHHGYMTAYYTSYHGHYYYIGMTGLTDWEDQDQDLYAVVIGMEDQAHIDSLMARQYFEENWGLFLGAFCIVICISLLVSWTISRPIQALEKVALKIKNNQFDEEINIRSHDEIGSLAKSIQSMSSQLKNTMEQLNQEIEHVKKLEGLRKDFVNQFTHEMKTPLGIINGYSELIEEATSQEEREKYLSIIHRETERLNQLIQSMLSLSRLEAGKVELHQEEFDLENSVTEIVDEYEVLLMKKHIQVDIKVLHPMIQGDRKLLETVIHNFLSNALKHTPEQGHIYITINHGFSIINEGSHIDEEHLSDIWYTFVTHDHQGSGLGLAICQAILQLHHYDYGVQNVESGVEFYFSDLKYDC